MKILVCHNSYRNPGGEDAAFEAHCELLVRHGHEAIRCVRDNTDIQGRAGIGAAVKSIWNVAAWREVRHLIDAHRPDLMHCHNLQFLLSPSVYWAARSRGVPVVQTLHNYRLVCPNALLFRDGMPCTLCAGKRFAWPGIRYACYRGSRGATAALAVQVWVHRHLGTWTRRVDQYIALTDFAKRTLSVTIPADKISVLPNFAPRPIRRAAISARYALFAGRLSVEKGVEVLAEAWKLLPSAVPLKIVGSGPLDRSVRLLAEGRANVELLGWQSRDRIQELIADAAYVLVPSTCFEGFPVIIAEAFSQGIPVIATRGGGLMEIVGDGETGYLCDPGNARSLADCVARAWQTPADRQQAMSIRCRNEYENHYSPEAHMVRLLEIYENVRTAKTASGSSRK